MVSLASTFSCVGDKVPARADKFNWYVLDRDLCLPLRARPCCLSQHRNNQRENMKNNTILGAVQAGRVLVSDGAWGTFFPEERPPAR